MNELAKKGKTLTLITFVSILLVSVYIILTYQLEQPELDLKKLTQQGIRFVLTVGLLYFIYVGKRWAVILTIFLFGLAAIMALFAVVFGDAPLMTKMPLHVMILVYSWCIYHFGASKAFKAFYHYQRGEE